MVYSENVHNTIPSQFHDGFVFLWRILVFLLVEKYIVVPEIYQEITVFCLQGRCTAVTLGGGPKE